MKLRPIFVTEPALAIHAKILRLDEPLSFWGGVEPQTGRLVDPPAGVSAEVAGRIVCVRRPRGSSSSSAVLLELIYRGLAPAALVLGEPDAILGLGAIVGLELGWRIPQLYTLCADMMGGLPQGAWASIDNHELVLRAGSISASAMEPSWPR